MIEKIEMVDIPGGEFLMGLSPGDPFRLNNVPQNLVKISPFRMSKYLITQGQWDLVMDTNLSYFVGGANLPVEHVTWNEAKEFCSRFSKKTGVKYRLPNEARWEYACRAGTTGSYAGELDEMGWHYENAGNTTHPVGQKKPNGFGLYDMHGNLWEWCSDFWHDSYEGTPTDGSTWLKEGDIKWRVVRGGSFDSTRDSCSSSYRGQSRVEIRSLYVGFRVMSF